MEALEAVLGALEGILEARGGIFEGLRAILEGPGAILEALGRLWGGSWRPSWRILGPSWTVSEAKLAVSRPTWEHLGGNLGGFGDNLAVLEATLHDFVDFAITVKNHKFFLLVF